MFVFTFTLLLNIFIYNVQTVEYSKSFLVNNVSSTFNFFDFDNDFVYIPAANDIVQRSLETNNVVRTFRGHSTTVADVFLLNGTMVSGSSDGLILLWDLSSGSILKSLSVKCDLFAMTYFMNNILITCSGSAASRMISFETGEEVASFDVGSFFFVHDDTFYSYYGSYGLVLYHRNLTSKLIYDGAVTAAIRYNDTIFGAHESLKIFGFSVITGEVYYFSGSGHTNYILDLLAFEQILISGSTDLLIISWDIARRTQLSIINCNDAVPRNLKLFDSTSFIFADSSGAAILCDFQSNRVIKKFQGNAENLQSLTIYDDYLFASSGKVYVKEWSISKKSARPILSTNVFSVALFVVSNYLVSCYDSVIVRDILTSAVVKEFGIGEVACWYGFYYSNGFVYVPLIGFKVEKFNLTSEQLILLFQDTSIQSNVASMFSYEEYFFSSHYQGSYVQWNNFNGNLLQTFPVLYIVVNSFVVRSDFYYTFNNQITKINLMTYDLSTPVITLFAIYSVCFDFTSNLIYLGSVSLIYGLDQNFEQVLTLAGHSNIINDLIVKDGFLFSCSEDGTVKQWQLSNRRLVYSFEDRYQSVTALLSLNDTLLVGTFSGNLNMFKISSAEFSLSILNHTDKITDIIFANGIVFVSSADLSVSLWNLSSLATIYTITLPTPPNSLFYADGFLYSGNEDSSIIQFNLTTGEIVKTFLGHSTLINDICAHGMKLYSAGSDSLIYRWDLRQGELEYRYVGHLDEVTSILVYEDRLLSSSLDKTIIIWDMAGGAQLKVLKKTPSCLGHLGPINQIRLCKSTLFSASSDLTIKQWDLGTGALIDTLFGHSKSVTSLSCMDHMLFSGSQDFSVFLWYPLYSESIKTRQVSMSKYSTKLGNVIEASVNHGGSPQTLVYIIIPVFIFVLLFLCFFFYIYRRVKDQYLQTSAITEKIDSVQSTTTITNGATLFTEMLGMAIPAYLEVQPTNFRLTKQIKKGGGGTVYLADMFGKQGIYIAKVLNESYTGLNPIMKMAFDQEITIMEFLKSHKNIAKIVGFCRQPCCILMKYYENGSFNDLIHSNDKITLFQIYSYLSDIAKGIEFIHSKAIVHGDLKPDNILIDTEKNKLFMVLTDFGISQIISNRYLASEAFHIANLRGLSTLYSAPEVFTRFRNKSVILSGSNLTAGDIYAYGIIIYETLTRSVPWK